ncbi:hypothetical protein GCM10009569_19140 [Arthrobacter russicus]
MLDAQQWGQVSFSLSLISIGLIALSAGLPQAISTTYFVADAGPRKARSLAAFGSWFSVLTALAIALAVGLWWFSRGELAANGPYLISILIIGMHGVTQMALAFLRSAHRALAFVVITVIATALGHVTGILAITFVERTANAYMISFAVAVFLASLLGVLAAKPKAPFEYPKVLRSAIAVALPVLPHSLALVLMLQGEAILITMFNGEEMVGRYNAVLPLALGALAVIMALSNVWQTTIFSHRGIDSTGEVKKVQREAAGVGVLLALGGSGAAVLVCFVIFPQASDDLLRLARLLPLLGYGYVMFLMATTQLFAIGRTRMMSVVTPVVAVAALLGAAWPASQGDLFAVGLIQVASYLVLGFVYCILVRRLNPSLVDFWFLLKGLAVAIAVTTVMVLLPLDIGTAIASFCIVALVGLAAIAIYYRRLRMDSRIN